MLKSLQDRISQSRRMRGNPWAYLNDEGNFDAFDAQDHLSVAQDISDSRKLLQDPYAHLNDKGKFDAVHSETEGRFKLSEKALQKLNPSGKKGRYSFSQIQAIANNLLREMWSNRENILGEDTDPNPIRLLDPSIGIQTIGYDFRLEESLGQFQQNGKNIVVAGIIDNDEKIIRISRQFPPNVRNYTAAHELGHALLHEATGLHRDRALDGPESGGQRDPIEKEADKFASYYLMPEKQVKEKFNQYFLDEKLSINENTLFALGSEVATKLRKSPKDLRLLSRTLAGLESYNGRHFPSLAQRFGVSYEAMAIRLEELELVSM